MVHPPWCDRQGCAERGWHASAPLTAGEGGTDVPVTVRATQLMTASAVPHLALQVEGGDDVLLGVAQAGALAWHLRRLIEDLTRAP